MDTAHYKNYNIHRTMRDYNSNVYNSITYKKLFEPTRFEKMKVNNQRYDWNDTEDKPYQSYFSRNYGSPIDSTD